MSTELDLSFLTSDEKNQLKSVLNRARLIEENRNVNLKVGKYDRGTEEIFRSTWIEYHNVKDQKYRTGWEVVTEALNISNEEILPEVPSKEKKQEEHKPPEEMKNIDENDDVCIEAPPEIVVMKESETHSLSEDTSNNADDVDNFDSPQISSTSDQPDQQSVQISSTSVTSESDNQELNLKPSKSFEELDKISPLPATENENADTKDPTTHSISEDNSSAAGSTHNFDSPRISSTSDQPVTSESENQELALNSSKSTEELDEISPLPAAENTPDLLKAYDTTSMISRSTFLHSNEFVGELNISLTYFPPGKIRQVNIPHSGTRFKNDNHLDVLSRKMYVALSGVKMAVMKDSESGAGSENDGELRLHVKDASDLRLPSVMRKKGKTYVKCYLLPDRYHGAKMRSEIVKESLNPSYNHVFVFRGFSKEEFNDRAIELVIGGVVSTRGRHLVVGGIRLSNGKQDQAKSSPLKESNEEEVQVWKSAFDKPCTEVTAALALQPHIKLTYK